MNLLVDANVLLDVLQDRKPFVKDSSVIWKLCETGQAAGTVSALTFANLVYVMRKELDPGQIEDVLRKLSMIFRFADFTASDLSKAAALKLENYEDAIQSVTAERVRADYIVTRNVRDFARSRVPARTPAEIGEIFLLPFVL